MAACQVNYKLPSVDVPLLCRLYAREFVGVLHALACESSLAYNRDGVEGMWPQLKFDAHE